MTEEQRKEIWNDLKNMNLGLNCIVGELASDRIIGRKTSFEYLDLQIESLREYVKEIATIVKEELES